MSLDNNKLIYGCMGLGGSWDLNPINQSDLKNAQAAIEAALSIGITHFDHADIYTLGKSEEIFGQVLSQKPQLRDRLTIQSKAGIRYHEFGNSSIYDLSKPYLLKQVDVILKRLNMDCLDIFMLHRPDPLMDPNELAETFSMFKASGKVKQFGVSNMTFHQIKFIQEALNEPLIANQIELSLAHPLYVETGILANRANEMDMKGVDGLLEYMQMHQITLQAYSSLAKGRFTGNPHLTRKEDKKTIALINQIAEKYKTHPESILLAWLFKIPGNIQPIIGSTHPNRILACKDAIRIDLTRTEWYQLWISARGNKIP